jgi:CRP/FNR family transcriptional regulator, cyclic AMP receptor protein
MALVLGYAASLAVLATFLTRTMMPLRVIAIVSNVLFVLYGHAADIMPVLVLHLVLLPINVYRLAALVKERRWAM